MSDILQRILILGASGQLGTELMTIFSSHHPAAVPHSELDIVDHEAVEELIRQRRPSLVINTAAFHKVEDCETNPARAFSVNTLAVDNLARICARSGVAFAHISTDYVFDGLSNAPYNESDQASPVNVYGISKLAGEMLIKRHKGSYFIFRTSGLFGRGGVSNKGVTFVERVLRSGERGESLKVVDDITFSPSYTPHVAASIKEIVCSGEQGTFHVTNSGSCTWYELACEALRAGKLTTHVEPIESGLPSGGQAMRPRFSVLDHGAIRRAGLNDLVPWQQAVAEYVTSRKS